MSAMGLKADVLLMSAYPQKRTLDAAFGMSAKDQ